MDTLGHMTITMETIGHMIITMDTLGHMIITMETLGHMIITLDTLRYMETLGHMTVTLTNGDKEQTTSDVLDRFYQRSHLWVQQTQHASGSPTPSYSTPQKVTPSYSTPQKVTLCYSHSLSPQCHGPLPQW